MISAAWESGFLAEEKEASLNAINLKSSTGIGLITTATSWCFFAS
jgi:hypothetical protein